MQDYFNLEIKKKSGLSLNPDIHHSKVPSSGQSISDHVAVSAILLRIYEFCYNQNTVLYHFLETGRLVRTNIGRNQLRKFLGFSIIYRNRPFKRICEGWRKPKWNIFAFLSNFQLKLNPLILIYSNFCYKICKYT